MKSNILAENQAAFLKIFTAIIFSMPVADVPAQPFQKSIGMQGLDQAETMQLLPGGDLIIAGQTNSYGSEQGDMLLMRADANGNILWTRTYGGIENETVNDVLLTADGGFLLTSEKYRLNSLDGEFLLMVKTDASGHLLWKKLFDEGGNETEGYSTLATADGGYLIAGIIKQANMATEAFFTVKSAEQNIYLLKINADGTKVWSRSFNPSGTQYKSSTGIGACPAIGGGFLVVGNLALNEIENSSSERVAKSINRNEARNVLLVKTDNNGNLQWSREYEGNQINMGFSVLPKKQGGYMMAGVTNTGSSDNIDIFLASLKDNGEIEWAKTYGGQQYDAISDIHPTPDGGYIVSGLTRSCGAGANDALLFKTDNSGNLSWAKAYGGSSEDGATGLATTPGGFIFAGDLLNLGSEGVDVYLVKTDAQGNSGCRQADCSFTTAGFSMKSKIIEGASMQTIKPKAVSFKSIDISNVKEAPQVTRTKNNCNN